MPVPAFSELLKNALRGNPLALKEWAVYLEIKAFSQEEKKEALNVFSNLTDEKEKSYSFYLQASEYYYEGNHSECVRLLEEAIKLGNSDAMSGRAHMYFEGLGGTKDEAKAFELIRRASYLGYRDAEKKLKELIKINQVVTPVPAFSELLKNALQGNLLALKEWAVYLEIKAFSQEEKKEALNVFSKLTDEKEKSYSFYLQASEYYYEGNHSECVRLLEEAIKRGNSDAMFGRAHMYFEGLGGTKDEAKAFELIRRASYLGDNEAEKELDELLLDLPIFLKSAINEESYKDSVHKSIFRIETVLDVFEDKIKKIKHHHYPQAHDKALELLKLLREYKEAYRKILLTGFDPQIREAGEQFNKNCEKAISQIRPILERDLGWGDYLNNLLKALVKAVICAVTLGQVNLNSFFTYKKSDLGEVVQETEAHLKPNQS